MPRATYILEVDWNGDDDFGDTAEDVTSYLYGVEAVRGRDYASSLTGQSVAGRLVAQLKNQDGRFSSFNSSSPIYGNILPGRKVRLRTTSPSAATLWTGFLDTIEPDVQPGPFNTATLYASGAFVKLAGPTAQISPAAQASVLTSDIVDVILDEVSWPVGARNIQTGVVPIDRWFVEDKSALTAIKEMEEAEMGFAYEGLAWDIGFLDRYYRVINKATSQATFSDAAAASLGYQGLRQNDPLREIFNSITAQIQPYSVDSLVVLWTYDGGSVTLAPGESITLIAQYPNSTSGSAAAYVNAWTTPVVGTDITQTGVSDGDIGVSVSKAATKMFITITNNHASTQATLTLVQARGTPVARLDPYQVKSEDSTSQTKYGLRTFPLGSPWYPSSGYAQAACDFFISRQKDPRPILTLKYSGNKSSDHMTQALARDLSDRVTVVAANSTKLGINQDFYIETIIHRIGRGGMFHDVEYNLAPADTVTQYWVLGTSVLGTGTRLAY